MKRREFFDWNNEDMDFTHTLGLRSPRHNPGFFTHRIHLHLPPVATIQMGKP